MKYSRVRGEFTALERDGDLEIKYRYRVKLMSLLLNEPDMLSCDEYTMRKSI